VRTAITVSALAHALFWGLNALSAPAPIAKPAETAITVDIVSPDEIGEAAKPPVSEKENSPGASAPTGAAQPEALASNSPPSPLLRPPPQREAARQPQQASQTKSTRAPAQSAVAAQAQAEPTPSGAAAPAPQDEPKSEPKPELPQFASSWLDAALSSLPVTASHYDESETTANLSQRDIATFKAHLQKCWNAPAGLADDGQLMAVLRVSLKPNGTLAGEPTMLAASASSSGPALLQTAMRALRQCQPYGFLPSAKYNEWKVLDLNFSPSGLNTRPALVSGFDHH
jgi:hypothetical protein